MKKSLWFGGVVCLTAVAAMAQQTVLELGCDRGAQPIWRLIGANPDAQMVVLSRDNCEGRRGSDCFFETAMRVVDVAQAGKDVATFVVHGEAPERCAISNAGDLVVCVHRLDTADWAPSGLLVWRPKSEAAPEDVVPWLPDPSSTNGREYIYDEGFRLALSPDGTRVAFFGWRHSEAEDVSVGDREPNVVAIAQVSDWRVVEMIPAPMALKPRTPLYWDIALNRDGTSVILAIHGDYPSTVREVLPDGSVTNFQNEPDLTLFRWELASKRVVRVGSLHPAAFGLDLEGNVLVKAIDPASLGRSPELWGLRGIFRVPLAELESERAPKLASPEALEQRQAPIARIAAPDARAADAHEGVFVGAQRTYVDLSRKQATTTCIVLVEFKPASGRQGSGN